MELRINDRSWMWSSKKYNVRFLEWFEDIIWKEEKFRIWD